MTDTKSITTKVYLEYLHEDKVLGQKIQGILRGKNIPFWDKNRDMAPGDDINDVFYDVLENCTHMIFIWSYWSACSKSLEFLIKEVKEKGLKIIPVVTSSKALPRIIGGVRPIHYTSSFDLYNQIVHGVLGDPDAPALAESASFLDIVPEKEGASTIVKERETGEKIDDANMKNTNIILGVIVIVCIILYILSFDQIWLVWVTLDVIVWVVIRIMGIMEQGKSEAIITAPGEEFKGYSKVREIISKAQDYVYLIDPWPAEETLIALNASRDGIEIRLLTHKLKDTIQQREFTILAGKFASQRPSFEVRIDSKYRLHDRFIMTESDVWTVGSSIKDVGNKLSVINLLKPESAKEIRHEVITIWNESEILSYSKENP